MTSKAKLKAFHYMSIHTQNKTTDMERRCFSRFFEIITTYKYGETFNRIKYIPDHVYDRAAYDAVTELENEYQIQFG